MEQICRSRCSFPENIRTVFAFDVTYDKADDRASVVVCSVFSCRDNRFQLVNNYSQKSTPPQPYVAGYLACRELLPVLKLFFAVLKLQGLPDLVCIDGCGSWHPHRCGMACYVQALTGVCCVGVSKKYLFVKDGARLPLIESVEKFAIDNKLLLEESYQSRMFAFLLQ